jgi:hypothetical protein
MKNMQTGINTLRTGSGPRTTGWETLTQGIQVTFINERKFMTISYLEMKIHISKHREFKTLHTAEIL